MTAATSAKNKSFFFTRFRNRISENQKLLIVNSIMSVLGLPLLTILMLYDMYLEQHQDTMSKTYERFNPDAMVAVSAIAIFITLLSGIVSAMSNFKYLYSKPIADMHYSLPLNSKQRFFADYLSGLAVYIVPAICEVILSLIIYFIGNTFIDTQNVGEAIGQLLMAIFIVIAAMILTYSLCVFAVTCTGSNFEAVFSVIAINAMIPAVIACVWAAIYATTRFGMSEESILYSQLLDSTSAIGNAIFFFRFFDEGVEGSLDSYVVSMYLRGIFSTLIFTGIIVAGAYFLYKFRKAESVSKPYVYKGFYYFIICGAVFCILSLFISFEGSIMAGIILCAIGWFIMEVITRRGFRRFWTAGLGFVATVGAVFAICGICKATEGFGTSRYVPSAIGVSRVQINMYHAMDYNEISFRDKDVIKAAIDLQGEIIDRHYNPENYTYKRVNSKYSDDFVYDNNNYISITYYMRTGSTVSREYSCTTGISDELVKAILLSDEYADYISNHMRIEWYHPNGSWYSDGTSIDKSRYSKGRINFADALQVSIGEKVLTMDEIVQLRDSYRTDLKNMTENDLKNHSIYGFIGDYDNLWILDSFENTISFLESHDFPNPSVDKERIGSYNGLRITMRKSPVYVANQEMIYGFGDGGYSVNQNNASVVDKITSATLYNNGYTSVDVSFSELNVNKNLVELLNRATPIVIGELPIAEIKFDGNTFYILDRGDNKALVEKVAEENYNMLDEFYQYDEYHY